MCQLCSDTLARLFSIPVLRILMLSEKKAIKDLGGVGVAWNTSIFFRESDMKIIAFIHQINMYCKSTMHQALG